MSKLSSRYITSGQVTPKKLLGCLQDWRISGRCCLMLREYSLSTGLSLQAITQPVGLKVHGPIIIHGDQAACIAPPSCRQTTSTATRIIHFLNRKSLAQAHSSRNTGIVCIPLPMFGAIGVCCWATPIVNTTSRRFWFAVAMSILFLSWIFQQYPWFLRENTQLCVLFPVRYVV